MSRTVKKNPATDAVKHLMAPRPEWHFERSPRYGNQRKQVAKLKVVARRKDRRNFNDFDLFYM